MKDLQFDSDIQEYIAKMKYLNYQVYLSEIEWQEALSSGLNKDIKDPISFLKFAPNDDADYKLLFTHYGCAYERP
jgi:hypothetical protein